MTVSRITERLFHRYAHLVIGHPIAVIFITITVSTFLTAWSVFFHYNIIDLDPTKGFETRGTSLSAARLTLEAMKPHQTSNENILRWYFEQDVTARKRRDAQNFTLPSTSTTTLDPITVNYDEYGVDSEPNSSDLEDHCEMFAAIGKSFPYDMIEYLGKVIIRVSSYQELFTISVLKHICRVDNIIDKLTTENNFTSSFKPLKHSLNLPLYTTCSNISTENSCDAINQNDVTNFQKLLKTCKLNSTLDICTVFSINQVNNWILPLDENSTELVINVVLKITMWDGKHDKNRKFYDKLIESLKLYLEQNPHTRMAGVALNMKNQVFQENIKWDSWIAGISALLVFLSFFLYSKSIIFTGMILIVVALSSGVAFFFYATVFRIDFFPFINLLVVVILISIGADDAFLLLVYFRREVEKLSTLEYKIGSVYVPLYRETDLLSRSLRLSLHHSLASMFVTSLTTATTFLTNLTSPVIVLRCFGIYAALTVVINYLLVVLILPGAIILTSSASKKLSTTATNWRSEKLTEFTYYFRFAIVFVSIVFTGISVLVIFYDPGLTIPRTNPTKLLLDSNVHEYYDNNAHRFNFQWQRSARLVKNFVFGIQEIKEPSGLSPYIRPTINFSETFPKFELTLEKLEYYSKLVNSELGKYKISNYTHTSWADQMLRANESCLSENATISSACILSGSVRQRNLIHQFPDDFAVIPGDGPFIDHDLNIVGYFISIPSDKKLRIDAVEISDFFQDIQNSCNRIKNSTSNDSVNCLSSTEITRFYDIVAQIQSSSFTSVVISIGVCLIVIICCIRAVKLSIFSSIVILFVILWTIASLILLGWKLSVVESTILIITIGLSFDYTLHYVVSIRDTKHVCATQKITSSHSTAGVACIFGAATLLLAGFPLLFTQTASFYQIGTMLIVLGITSFFGAAIVLPAYVITFSCGGRKYQDEVVLTKL